MAANRSGRLELLEEMLDLRGETPRREVCRDWPRALLPEGYGSGGGSSARIDEGSSRGVDPEGSGRLRASTRVRQRIHRVSDLLQIPGYRTVPVRSAAAAWVSSTTLPRPSTTTGT